ncbi:hypothetical protein K7X08_035296 [Anisodus acutangulus]|uniref:Uncharacterized protein n=1 Tax=Anisodus acutangulus TaxID=402998 RepID=A0A9Q1R0G7_9SOLA|nr:hypothetical protein K7X08_035296 [Anisodus acutangulus]
MSSSSSQSLGSNSTGLAADDLIPTFAFIDEQLVLASFGTSEQVVKELEIYAALAILGRDVSWVSLFLTYLYMALATPSPPVFVDLETIFDTESPSPRKPVPKQPRRSGGVVIRDYSEEIPHKPGVPVPAEDEEEIEGPRQIRRRRLHKASDAPLHIGGSSPLSHALVHSQDPSSAALKATISPAKTVEASYAWTAEASYAWTTEDSYAWAAEASYAWAAIEETAGDNPSAEAHPTDDSESLQLDNKIRELGNQQVVWERDQKAGSERLAKLENEWTAWKICPVQAMPTITTPLPADPIAELSADTFMDLQSKAIATSVIQEVSIDTQAFTEASSTVVVEPLLGAEREVQT